MPSSLLFVGGEDLDFQSATGFTVSPGTHGIGIDATAGRFRTKARYAISIPCDASGGGTFNIRSALFTGASYWLSFYLYSSSTSANANTTVLSLCDASDLPRLRIRCNLGGAVQAVTVNTAGTETQIGSNFAAQPQIGLQKVDIFVNYAVAGRFTVYFNSSQVFNFTGDVTTNSVTTLGSKIIFGPWNVLNGITFGYSEIIVATRDTRSLNLETQVATANGNTHNFDGGTAANLAATSMATGDAAPNFATAAGLIQEYQFTPALPAGNYGVICVVHSIRAVVGITGPSKLEAMIRLGGTDYVSADLSLTGSYSNYQVMWDLNPNTGLPWVQGDIVNSSTLYNFGMKTIT